MRCSPVETFAESLWESDHKALGAIDKSRNGPKEYFVEVLGSRGRKFPEANHLNEVLLISSLGNQIDTCFTTFPRGAQSVSFCFQASSKTTFHISTWD
jgi:hypothetical protein